MGWPVVATILLAGLAFFHFVLGEFFVRAKSEHYADSLLATMSVLTNGTSSNALSEQTADLESTNESIHQTIRE